jgi:hypothetical protein
MSACSSSSMKAVTRNFASGERDPVVTTHCSFKTHFDSQSKARVLHDDFHCQSNQRKDILLVLVLAI